MAKRQTTMFDSVLITANQPTATGRIYGLDSLKSMRDAISTGKILVYAPDNSVMASADPFSPDLSKAEGYVASAILDDDGKLTVSIAAFSKGILGKTLAAFAGDQIVTYPVGTGSIGNDLKVSNDYKLMWVGWNLKD
jgi:hypothetical protein